LEIRNNVDSIILSDISKLNKIESFRKVQKFRQSKLDCYITKENLELIKKEYGSEFIEPRIIEPGKKFKLKDTNIEMIPFKCGNSIGFRFDNIVYLPSDNVSSIDEKNLYNARSFIVNGELKSVLNLSNKFKPSSVIFTNPEDLEVVKKEWRKMQGYKDTEFLIGVNNTYEIGREFTQRLMESKKTMSISSDKCKDIVNKTKTIIIKDKLVKELTNSTVYLTDDTYSYGVIKIGNPYKIDTDDFEKLSEEHRITKSKAESWWPNKLVLFAYPFEIVDLYKNKRRLDDNSEVIEKTETWGDDKLLDDLGDFTVIKDCICAMGSYVAKREGHTPNDLDILIKLNPDDYMKRAIETRIRRMFKYPDRLHFVYGDHQGPHDKFLPLFDLKFERIKDAKVVQMSESDLTPMKPSKKFYDLDELKNNLNEIKYAVEEKIDGFRAVGFKVGDNVKLFSEQGVNITNAFSTISKQLSELSGKDFIIDGELAVKGGSRSDISKYISAIKSGEVTESKNVIYHVFDILKLNEDLSSKTWNERKSILHSLSFTKNIKEVDSLIVSSPDDVIKAVKIVSRIPSSEGAVIKEYDGEYKFGSESETWIKFRNRDKLIVKVIDVIKETNGNVYTVGVDANDKVDPKFVKEGMLVLGNTFVTEEEFKVNDVIEIAVEEVWRHEGDKVHYSIHKPSVISESNVPLTTISDLDKLVVSKGESVVTNESKYPDKELYNKWKDLINMSIKELEDFLDSEEGSKAGLDKSEADELGIKSGKESASWIIKMLPSTSFEKASNEWTNNMWEWAARQVSFISRMEGVDGPLYDEKGEKTRKHLALLVCGHDPTKKENGATTTDTTGISDVQGKEITEIITRQNELSNISNHEFFDKWTPESAYFFGLLSTDGNLDNNTDRIEFYMSKEDSKILNVLADLLGDQVGPKEISGYIAYRFKSKYMADRLRSLGMGVRKKEREAFKHVPNEFKWDFARGSFDGDGSITEDRIQYDNECKQLVNWMVKLFKTVVDDVKHYEYDNMGKIVVMHENATKVLDKLYSRKPYFERKKNKSVTNQDEEGGTREDYADKFWADNWQDQYPKETKKFVFHNHWRGLTESESKLDNKELLDTDNSIHSDLRMEKDDSKLFGFTVFTGEASENKKYEGNKLIYMAKNKGEKDIKGLEGTFKINQPHEWLDIDNYVSEPGGPGATSKGFAKFFAIDKGEFEAGTWREHMFEFFMNGKELKGRMIVAYVPIGGSRKWIVDFPIDQTPYSKSHDKEETIKELKSKGQKYLIWNEDGKAERIEI